MVQLIFQLAISDERNPYLGFYGVFGCAKERFYMKVLLDPFEK